jgi:hypothetical protein
LAAVHFEARKFLLAYRARHIAIGVVFDDAIYYAFDQTASPPFVIFVKEGFAFGA